MIERAPTRDDAPSGLASPAAEARGLRRGWPLLALAAVTVVVVLPAALHDFRDNPPVGDQVAHVFLALSFAYDSHTMNFDRLDSQHWSALRWGSVPTPRSLFFQRHGDGWAASKPYGYPLFLSPFIATLGVGSGVAVGNATLLLALILGSALLAWRRYDGLTAVLLVGAFYVASMIAMYAYPVHTELFLAFVTLVVFGAVFAYRQSRRLPWAGLAFAAMAVGIAEKAAFAPLFAPLAVVLLLDRRREPRALAGMIVPGLVALALAVTPYLVYSDGETFTPYTGDRYQVNVLPLSAQPPWAGGIPGRDYRPITESGGGILSNALEGKVSDRLASAAYYFVGRYTGMLVTIPLGLLLLAAVLARVRAADRWTVAALVGLLAYIAFYVVVFPTNYYGGGQSVGDRYLVQVAPAILVLALFAPLSARLVRILSVAGIALALLLIAPQLRDPDRAFVEFARSSAVQRLLPFESNQDYAPLYQPQPTQRP